jgi:uncharacterized protein
MIRVKNNVTTGEGNTLFPVFLKLEQLRLLIIGGGKVAFEKLSAVLQNSPMTQIQLVGIDILDNIWQIAADYPNVTVLQRPYILEDLEQADIIIVAVNSHEVSRQIRNEAHHNGKLVNIADKPELCDFYLGSIVKKGNLKIAISTNGKSPTIAKRLKEQLLEMVPEEIDGVLDNMHRIRNSINGDFAGKVKQLNDITSVLAAKQITLEEPGEPGTKRWQKIVKWCLFAFFFMILGHGILSYVPFHQLIDSVSIIPKYIDTRPFFVMFVTGFVAQMVDGSLGMGYGTISTTFLLAYGVNPAIVSSRVHSARVFSSGVSGYSHHRFGNINKKLFRTLVVPGIIGAVIGASLAFFAQRFASYIKIPVSVYTIYLGYFIMAKAFKKNSGKGKIKKAGWLATAGGFMDSFVGGGWGTLVTSALISKRKSPRYVVGSVCLAEFFVVLFSSITFFILLKSLPLVEIAGLIFGGLVAAPIAAKMVGKIPVKKMFIAIGILVILTSLTTICNVLFQILHI